MKRIATVTLNPALDRTISVEQLNIGQKNIVIHSRLDLGGKGINVARVLAHLGYRPEATGWLGKDDAKRYKDELINMGIQPSFVYIPQKIRTNLKIIDTQTGMNTDLNEIGFTIDPPELNRFLDHYDQLLSDLDVIVLAGSLPRGVDEHFYTTLIEKAKQHQILTFLDTNGVSFAHAVQSSPYAVKPNREELEDYLGHGLTSEQDVLKAGQLLLSHGIQLVTISLGAEGGYFFKQDQVVRARPPEIQVKSPVGAGDSMLAGMIVGVMNEWKLERIARFATASGSATAAKPGTELCNQRDVEQLLPQVQIELL